MSIDLEKCDECGCPQISNLYHSFSVHYKNCSILGNLIIGRKRKVSTMEWRKKLAKFLKYRRDDVQYVTTKLQEARDCIKNTCLDEVYECRWDCRTVPA